jgi:hypothetical protein
VWPGDFSGNEAIHGCSSFFARLLSSGFFCFPTGEQFIYFFETGSEEGCGIVEGSPSVNNPGIKRGISQFNIEIFLIICF